MNGFLSKYSGRVLQDWGSELSPDFRAFARGFRSYLKAEGEDHGFSLEKFTIGHYFMSAFLKSHGRYVYLSYENRYRPIDVFNSGFLGVGVLIRTANGPKDYTGGQNYYTSIAEVGQTAERMLSA